MPINVKLSAISICLLVFSIFALIGFTAYAVYGHTKKSYYSVGFNDGSIAANMDFLKRISEKTGVTHKCSPSEMKGAELIISVKSDALYLIKNSASEQISFCIPQ